jgi:hypothetical protein
MSTPWLLKPAGRLGAREALAAAIIAAQLVGIALGRFTHESFWSWVPHDRVLAYEMRVTLGGRDLMPEEIRSRYGVGEQGYRVDYLQDLTALVRLREERRPDDRAGVVLHYSVNGGERASWRWPEP